MLFWTGKIENIDVAIPSWANEKVLEWPNLDVTDPNTTFWKQRNRKHYQKQHATLIARQEDQTYQFVFYGQRGNISFKRFLLNKTEICESE